MSPLVSIVTPTYNRIDSLTQVFHSVIDQTLSDWEWIIADDCSDDGTQEIVKKWEKDNPRIRYFRFEENTGSPVVPRNWGCYLARGKYVAFLDDDDLWYPHKLQIQVDIMEGSYTPLIYHDMEVRYPDKVEQWSQMASPHSGKQTFRFLLRKNFIPTSSVIVRKETLDRFKTGSWEDSPMDPRYGISHDWDLWLKIAFHEYVPIDYLGMTLGVLRMQDRSVITKVHRRRRECRQIVRSWKDKIDEDWYRKVLAYYYLMEGFDLMPKFMQEKIRKLWYRQRRYK